MATKLGQKNNWCKLKMVVTSIEVKCGKLCFMATIFVQKNLWSKFQDDDENGNDLHEGQRSTEVKIMNMLFGYQTWSEELLMQV